MMSSAQKCLRAKQIVAIVAASACSLVGVALLATPAGAATVAVTNNHDSGAGSLRAALEAATGTTTVNVQPGLGTITLASPIVFPDSESGSITIHGNGIAIDANTQPSGLQFNGDALDFDHFSITGVGGSRSHDAAAIMAEGGSMRVSNCTMRSNAVHASGHDAAVVLSEGGALTVASCTLTGNTVLSDGVKGDAGVVVSEGGGLNASGCTVASNHVNAQGDGATLLSEGGALVVSSCDVAKNTVVAGGNVGGGADSEGGGVTFRNVDVTCNTATSDGGDAAGGLLNEGGDVTITGSTVAGNVAATTGDGIAKNQVNSRGSVPSISTSTISDDKSVCKAAATTTTTAAPATTAATVPVTGASAPATTVAAQAQLPRTGSSSSALGLLGVALVTIGATFTYGASGARRRRNGNA